MNTLEKAISIGLAVIAIAVLTCIESHAETVVGSGYDRNDKPFTNWMFTDEGAGGTLIINGGSNRTGMTYIFGAGKGVRAREREAEYWTANPLGKGFNK